MAKNNTLENTTKTQKEISSPDIIIKDKTMYTSEKIVFALSGYIQQEYYISFCKSLDKLKEDPNIDMEILNTISDTVSDYIENTVNKRISEWILRKLADFNSIDEDPEEESENITVVESEKESTSSKGERVVGFAAN